MSNQNTVNTILRLDASMRKNGSYSRDLSDRLIDQLTSKNRANIIKRDLVDGIPLIDENWINANFTALDDRTDEQSEYLKTSDMLVEELKQADQIVIGLPVYNFGVPAAFKAWIDQVVRSKLTFKYSDAGPIGLLKDKPTYIVIASGGTRLGSELDFISDYLHHILGFIGIKDITIIDSSGLGKDEAATLAEAHNLIDSL